MLLRTFARSKVGMGRMALSSLKAKKTGITVNGVEVTVRYILRAGDIVRLEIEDLHSSAGVEPFDAPLDIIYEDSALLCINKPPFLAVHPVKKLRGDTLAARVTAYLPSPYVFRCATRLDRDTSGVVVISKNRVAASKISGLLALHDGRFKKKYILIVRGAFPENSEIRGEISLNIRRVPGNPIKRETIEKKSDIAGSENDPEGCFALTKYRVLVSVNGYHLVLVNPVTGRTHQIRAHFAGIGLLPLGDALYGEESRLIGRQALHCLSVSFPHPETGDDVVAVAPVPEDFRVCAEALFGAEYVKYFSAALNAELN
ncbi:MAG: RluA family pseudouridine synthase [Oscillospiraceae bacterium]|nr:RluA family pseudouridine synthase [Oscillospiraceae bacterium]